MGLWKLIIYLRQFHKKYWVVENVKPYYDFIKESFKFLSKGYQMSARVNDIFYMMYIGCFTIHQMIYAGRKLEECRHEAEKVSAARFRPPLRSLAPTPAPRARPRIVGVRPLGRPRRPPPPLSSIRVSASPLGGGAAQAPRAATGWPSTST